MTATRSVLRVTAVAIAAVCGLAIVTPTMAQSRMGAVIVNPQRDTLGRMLKPVNTEFKETRLEDVVKFLGELTGADIEPMWVDEQHPTGLDKEKLITVKSNGLTALKLLERVLEKAGDEPGANTWQLSDTGALQIGPKVRLNTDRRIAMYDINDLLMVVPEFTNAPQFDLQSVLQNSGGTGGGGGGGGGQSPFRDTQQQGQNGQQGGFGVNIAPRQERIDNLQKLIVELVEPEQWADNGGNGGTIRYYQGAFIVNAPDYMHRQINGYPFWPQRQTNISQANGHRYVSFNASTSINKIDGFVPIPVTAVVGGNPGGGGGTPPPPPPPPPGGPR